MKIKDYKIDNYESGERGFVIILFMVLAIEPVKNNSLKIISFDMEGTLATPDFSNAVWHEGVPALYAEAHGLEFNEARKIVTAKYNEIGDQRPEWYDIKYWFQLFGLSDHRALMERYRSLICYYADAKEILQYFALRYNIVVVSSSTREFLPYLLNGLDGFSNDGKGFMRVFSSISDYGSLKTPDFYLKVCQELEIEPDEMVHIGDSFRFDYLNPLEVGIKAFYLDREKKVSNPQSLKSLADLKNNFDKSVNIEL